MNKNFITIILILILIFISGLFKQTKAQDKLTVKDSIYSEILREQRDIVVRLPESYDPASDTKYEVIYLVDGEWTEHPFSFIQKYAQDNEYVPPVILVAVKNRYIDGANQRDRDFLPVHVPQPAISGGADKFLAFLKTELMPYIDKNYKTNGENSLYGHSYGGLFVAYTLFTMPGLFETFYATDPAFWYNNDYIIKLAGEKLGSLPPGKIFWVAGITETFKGMKIDKMDSVLKAKAPETLHWKVVTFPNEKHNSVGLKGIYDGIKFAYSGYSKSPLVFHPMNGILLKDTPINVFVESNGDIRYTTDGTEPDKSSPLAEQGFSLTGPAELTVKSFSTSGKYDKTVKGKFELGGAFPSVKKPQNAKSGGLKYSVFEGDFKELPDFKKLKPLKSGIADSTFNLKKLGDSDFACLFEGYFEAEDYGHYLFGLSSNDGSRFYLNNKLIIDNSGIHPPDEFKSFVLPLEKGFYPVRIEYFGKDEGKSLQLIYVKPGTTNGNVIPLSLLYNK
ncbi:MAG: chitobiase/beta-hexosaminidase C-terminal domain-containing protein [Prolixibacteraceae bacterium]|nr:chitobiase/beta-hexosaminidase C-terminal domain-containing protein [Prolixibacteraceae bacterium]